MSQQQPPRLESEHPTALRRDSGTRAVGRPVTVVPKLTLEIRRESGREPRVVVHEGPVCRIGTHSSNDVVLFDPSVSRFHCKLTCDGAGWRVQDSGSLNGTKVNGVRVRDADLKSEGTLALGDCLLTARGLEPAIEEDMPDGDASSSFGALAGTSVAMRKLFALPREGRGERHQRPHRGRERHGQGARRLGDRPARPPRRQRLRHRRLRRHLAEPGRERALRARARRLHGRRSRSRSAPSRRPTGAPCSSTRSASCRSSCSRSCSAPSRRRRSGASARPAPARSTCASSPPPTATCEREVNRGRFREDLYFRLAVMTVHVPPLRERIDDLPVLVRSFLAALGVTAQDQRELFSPSVLAELAGHDWPGNVRELRNYVERSVVLQEALPASRPLPIGPPSASGGEGDAPVPFKLAKDRSSTPSSEATCRRCSTRPRATSARRRARAGWTACTCTASSRSTASVRPHARAATSKLRRRSRARDDGIDRQDAKDARGLKEPAGARSSSLPIHLSDPGVSGVLAVSLSAGSSRLIRTARTCSSRRNRCPATG